MNATALTADADRPPWGLWASLAWYVVIFEIAGRIYELGMTRSGLQALIDRSYPLHVLGILAGWAVTFFLIVLAARLTQLSLRDYLGWVRPRISDVVLGLAIVAALYSAFGAFLIAGGGTADAVNDYRTAIAGGMSPWWFVLKWWPTLILSPFVEETFFRGFLWRGVQFHHGNWVAFLVTTVLFAAMHYGYWMPNGVVEWGSVVQYLVASSIYGALRWRSGGSIVPMLAHSLDNAGLRLLQIALSAIVP